MILYCNEILHLVLIDQKMVPMTIKKWEMKLFMVLHKQFYHLLK